MNRFVYGQGWAFDETDGEGGDAGGGAGKGAPAGEGDDAGDGAQPGGDGDSGADGAAPAAGADKKEPAPKDMKAAIDAALGYTKPAEGAQAGDNNKGAKPAEKKPAAADGKETDTQHANGKPKKGEKGEDLDAEGKVVTKAAPKAKTAAELDLKPDQLKLLKPETQARFREVIGTLKEREATITNLTTANKALAEARDGLLGTFEEVGMSKDHLSNYVAFHALLQSQDPKDLEAALEMIEDQRAAIYTALGREPQGGGIDLLKEFPDLAKQVEDEEITRAAALEIAKSRRDKVARDAATRQEHQQRNSQQQSVEQRKKAGDTALAEIEKWTGELTKSDLDYKAKEDKLLAKLPGVLNNYPPDKWLTTLKLLYEGIEIQKAPATTGGPRPLRPSGAKPGAKAPSTMKEAIDAGLGYAGAEKG